MNQPFSYRYIDLANNLKYLLHYLLVIRNIFSLSSFYYLKTFHGCNKYVLTTLRQRKGETYS